MKTHNTIFLLILVILTSMIYSCKNPSQTKVIAHRGASGYATENTIPAVEKAVEMNSDAVEVDIWRTIDDSLIVFHDRNTERLTSDSLVIPESTYKELRALKLPEGNFIPTLREVLEILPSDTEIFIEIKCGGEEGEAGQVFPMLGNILRETGTLEQTAVISFNTEKLKEAADNIPAVPIYWLTGKQQPVSGIINVAKDAGADGINVHHSLLSAELINQAQNNNLDVYVWTVNDPENAAELSKNYRIDGITTNYPDTVREAIKTE